MHYKVEPSGCCERKGLVQVRYSLYFDSGDAGYQDHHVIVPVIPEDGYKGKMKDGMPVDQVDYSNWLAGLPTVEQDNPFHNHFSYFESTVTDAELHAEGKRIIEEALSYLEKKEFPNIKSKLTVFDANATETKKNMVKLKVNELKVKSITNKK